MTMQRSPLKTWREVAEEAQRDLADARAKLKESEQECARLRPDAGRWQFTMQRMFAVAGVLNFYQGFPEKFVAAVDNLRAKVDAARTPRDAEKE